MRGFLKFSVAFAVILGSLVGAQGAAANTYCVPDYSAACPATGINEKVADLNDALSQYGADGNPDKVIIAAGTLTASTSFTAPGTDPLEIVGAGRDKTFLTSSAAGNGYVLDLISGSNRVVTVKDLSVVIPTSFSTGAGVAESADNFESVDLITRNEGSAGVYNPTAGSSFTDVRAFGQNGAEFGAVFYQQNFCGSGEVPLKLSRVEISDAAYGLSWNCPTAPVELSRARFHAANAAINLSEGGQLDASDVLIESAEGPPVRLTNFSNKPTRLSLRHATIVATGDPNQPAIRARVDSIASPSKDIEIELSDSVVSGFQQVWSLEAPIDPVKGNVTMSIDHSILDATGVTAGESSVAQSDNLSGTPDFLAADDFHLAAGSMGIDAGDPAEVTPSVDLDGNPRPVDGDGDGSKISDMGAFEFQPPTCATDPSLCPPDTTAPVVSQVRFKFRSRKGGSLRMRLSEAAMVKVTFKPVPRKVKKGPKRKVVKISRKAKAGGLTIKLGKRRLATGRYRISIVAIDEASNKSKAIRKNGRALPPRKR